MPDIKEALRDVQSKLREMFSNEKKPLYDEKETSDRLEASKAYAGESPQHFVDYCMDCVKTSTRQMKMIREAQRECLRVYFEEAPPNYHRKEKWQSKVILPKPFSTVQYAMATIRKAFSTDFISVENPTDQKSADIWEKIMKHYLNRSHSNFPLHFTDAAGMGLAIGQSMEMIPVWRPGVGLKWIAVEPWKIQRDPDAFCREPQSGMYWIHQEYLDWHILKQGQMAGRYKNIDKVSSMWDVPTGTHTNLLTPHEIALRKEQLWQRSDFRKSVLTSEFWGQVLSPKGELLLPNATYTVAGSQVIGEPKMPPYPRMRWPGISFSPLPHFLRFDGRGLVHSIKSLWYFMCSLMALHHDYMNWVVNPMTEITLGAVMDQDELTTYPGKPWLVRETVSGQQVVRTIDRKSIASDMMAYLNWIDQQYQRGSMVTDSIRGLPGYRQQVTAREAAQNLEQSETVFGSIATNVEDGAIWAVDMAADVIKQNIAPSDLEDIFGKERVSEFVDPETNDVILPEMSGAFHVSGISTLMKNSEVMKSIRDVIMPMVLTQNSPFMPYINILGLVKSIEKRLNLRDEDIVVDDATAEQIAERQREQSQSQVGQEQAQQQREHEAKMKNLDIQHASLQQQIAKTQGEMAEGEEEGGGESKAE